MKYQDDELVMISALQHYLFCPRQCALIHLEQQWQENYLTAAGRLMHERVDRRESSTRRDIHYASGLRIFSQKYGLVGIADMVEFQQAENEYDDNGKRVAIPLKGLSLFWKPFPVEYKRGSPKVNEVDQIQLCAQAICIEEMLNVEIAEGALFYGQTRHREYINFSDELRKKVLDVSDKIHMMFQEEKTPPPHYCKSCQACSLKDLCIPEQNRKTVDIWLDSQIEDALLCENY